MKPQIPWLRVFVEGVVIVGSILLAFGIQAWWDESQEREEEQEALAGLSSDFQANIAQLEFVSTLRADSDAAALRLFTMSDEELRQDATPYASSPCSRDPPSIVRTALWTA